MNWLIFLPALFPAIRLLLAGLFAAGRWWTLTARRRAAPAAAIALSTLLIACGSDRLAPAESESPPATTPAAQEESIPAAAPAATPSSSPARLIPAENPGEVNPILATKTLEVGRQRVAFLLVGQKALIKLPTAEVDALYLGNDGGARIAERATAVYHPWPYGIRGAYSAELTFDRPGPWRLDIAVADANFAAQANLELNIVDQSPVPAIGARPPLTQTKTLAEVADPAQLTTDYTPDPDLYRLSLAAAIQSPRPAVIAFASPAFCVSATCGPQVDALSELKAAYPGQADFVHVEIYADPQAIQGDLTQAKLAPAVDEWGFSALPYWRNESWVFVLDGQGIVRQRFEGFATKTELETALQSVLAAG